MQPLSLAIKQLATLATTKITSHLEVTDCGLELKDVHSHNVTTPFVAQCVASYRPCCCISQAEKRKRANFTKRWRKKDKKDETGKEEERLDLRVRTAQLYLINWTS